MLAFVCSFCKAIHCYFSLDQNNYLVDAMKQKCVIYISTLFLTFKMLSRYLFLLCLCLYMINYNKHGIGKKKSFRKNLMFSTANSSIISAK